MSQTQIFIDHAGDDWFERNERKLGQRDPVSDALVQRGIVPRRVLEIGCANGWRMKKFKQLFGCEVSGIDPAKRAIWQAQSTPGLAGGDFRRGWADSLPFEDGAFDMVVYGFCLYVTEPKDWFQIVAEGNRVLADDGYIVVHDFADHQTPHAVKYEHADDVLAYHVNFAGLWLINPLYRMTAWMQDGDELVAIVRKSGVIPVWEKGKP